MSCLEPPSIGQPKMITQANHHQYVVLLVYQPCPPIEYVHLGRPCQQVDYPPVIYSKSSNCSDNGNNVPTQSQDEHLDTQTDAQVLAENISDYDYDGNHSHSSLDDENTDCHDSDYQHGYPLDHLIDHSDLDSSWNSDNDSWFSLENSPGHPPISQENPPTEADPYEAMAEEQPFASQPTVSPVVMANRPSCTPTPPYQDDWLPVMISLGCRNTLFIPSPKVIFPQHKLICHILTLIHYVILLWIVSQNAGILQFLMASCKGRSSPGPSLSLGYPRRISHHGLMSLNDRRMSHHGLISLDHSQAQAIFEMD